MLSNEEARKIHVLSQDGEIDNSLRLVRVDHVSDDDISLVDMWLTLVKHRWVILAVLATCVLLAAIYLLYKPSIYQYSVALQIGTIINENGQRQIQYIESPDNVLAKLRESYIPQVMSNYRNSSDAAATPPKITARIPRKSELIVIETRGTEEQAASYKNLLHQVVNLVSQDQQPQANMIRSGYDAQIKKEQIVLASLENATSLKSEKSGLENKLLQARIALEKLQNKRLQKVQQQQLLASKKEHQNKLSALDDESRQLTSELKQLDKMD